MKTGYGKQYGPVRHIAMSVSRIDHCLPLGIEEARILGERWRDKLEDVGETIKDGTLLLTYCCHERAS